MYVAVSRNKRREVADGGNEETYLVRAYQTGHYNCDRGLPNEHQVRLFETHVIYDLDRVASQVYADVKIIKLPQTLTELCHFQTFRGNKLKLIKRWSKFWIILLNDQHRSFITTSNVTI